MATQYRPEIGAWYQLPGGELFEVVAHDSDEGTVDIQYFDGAIEELDMETWNELGLMSAEPPEDFTGPLDMMREDNSYSDLPPRQDMQIPFEGVDFDP